jgi:hypothetical protein
MELRLHEKVVKELVVKVVGTIKCKKDAYRASLHQEGIYSYNDEKKSTVESTCNLSW